MVTFAGYIHKHHTPTWQRNETNRARRVACPTTLVSPAPCVGLTTGLLCLAPAATKQQSPRTIPPAGDCHFSPSASPRRRVVVASTSDEVRTAVVAMRWLWTLHHPCCFVAVDHSTRGWCCVVHCRHARPFLLKACIHQAGAGAWVLYATTHPLRESTRPANRASVPSSGWKLVGPSFWT